MKLFSTLKFCNLFISLDPDPDLDADPDPHNTVYDSKVYNLQFIVGDDTFLALYSTLTSQDYCVSHRIRLLLCTLGSEVQRNAEVQKYTTYGTCIIYIWYMFYIRSGLTAA
jgi:hypothetical protein